MYSLTSEEKEFVKQFMAEHDLKKFITDNDWGGFWKMVDHLRRQLPDDDSISDCNTFTALMLTICHLTGIDPNPGAAYIVDCTNAWESVLCLPKGVELIGTRAFAWNEQLEYLYIDPSIKKIGKDAFAFCGNLKEITLDSDWEYYINTCINDFVSWRGILPQQLKKIKFNYI